MALPDLSGLIQPGGFADQQLGVEAPQLQPPVPDLPQQSFAQRFLANLAGVEPIQGARQANFGEGLLSGLTQGLGSAGARALAQRQRLEAIQQQQQVLRNEQNLKATEDYRQNRAKALQDVSKFGREHVTLTAEMQAANPELAAIPVGTPVSPNDLKVKPKSDEVTDFGKLSPAEKRAYLANSASMAAAKREPKSPDSDAFNPADYVDQTPEGVPYVNLGQAATPKAKQAIGDYARANHIVLLNDKSKGALDMVHDALGNLDAIEQTANNILPSNALSRTLRGPLNLAEGAAQTNPDISSFNAYRTTAIQTIQALASLGTGLRINQAEIQAALKYDIPKVTDTQDVAAGKLAKLRGMLSNIKATILNSGKTGTAESRTPQTTTAAATHRYNPATGQVEVINAQR